MVEIDFRGKVAMVTGAGRSIGAQIALTLAEAGADLVLNDLTVEASAEVAARIEGMGRRVLQLAGDVGDEAAVAAMFARVKEVFGRVDILVNNAGITRDSTVKKMTLEQFELVMRVNLSSVFLCCKQAYLLMKEVGAGGSMINISSMGGFTGNFGQANYSASKAAIYGMGKTMALEFAKAGIRVNTVAPGYVDTPMTQAIPEAIRTATYERIPMGRVGQCADIANAVLFLASALSSYMTGQVLHVNGGYYM